jgi:hypothetical protein
MNFPKGTNLDEILSLMMGTHSVEIQEVFTHIDDEMKLTRKWNVTLLRRWLKNNPQPLFNIVMDDRTYHFCKNLRGYEQHRLDRITMEVIDKIPVIFCMLEDGMTVMVDGTHRCIKAYEAGRRLIVGHILNKDVWEQFLMPVEEDITAEELLKKKSGL